MPFDKVSHDLGIRPVPPASITDPRQPMAEEFDLDSQIQIGLFQADRRSYWRDVPPVLIWNSILGRIEASGVASLAIFPESLSIAATLSPVPLSDTTSSIDRLDFHTIVGFAADVGQEHDVTLGQVSFGYQIPNGIQGVTKENSRRYRAFWVVISSRDPLTRPDIVNLLTGGTDLTIVNGTDAGFAIGLYRIYAKDPNLTVGTTYKLLPGSICLLSLCALRRRQRSASDGHIYGENGEIIAGSDLLQSVEFTEVLSGSDIDGAIRRRAIEIARAQQSGRLKGEKKFTLNLAAGSVPANLTDPGIAAVAPNGSTSAANDRRLSFTNQSYLEQRAAFPVTAGNSGGAALVSIGLNTNSPPGTVFSIDPTAHKIYKADGTEQSSLGVFNNLGGAGALSWIGTSNSTLLPGETVWIAPGITYPAGSGLGIPFNRCERAWYRGIELDPNNIIDTTTGDLDDYQSPAAGQDFICAIGKERAAIHYIYEKVSITVGIDGIAKLPAGKSGGFAFIDGTTLGRIDAPVVGGLPVGSYNALIYSPPSSAAADIWQFQFSQIEYQGLGNSWFNFVDGATIASNPIVYAHTHGGGSSVFQGDESVRYSPIAMHLPLPTGNISNYDLDTPIHLSGESYPGPVSWRELPAVSGKNVALPFVGQKIFTLWTTATTTRGCTFKLISTDGNPLGCFAPQLATKRPYQIVIAFAIAKSNKTMLIVAAHNTVGGETIVLDPELGTGIDVFEAI